MKVNREMYSSWRDDDKIKGSFLEWTLGHDPREKEWLITWEIEWVSQGAKSLRFLEQLGSREHVLALMGVGG